MPRRVSCIILHFSLWSVFILFLRFQTGELSKTIRLTNLSITHNVRITDIGVFSILSNSSKLNNLVLKNCPNLTIEAVRSLYQLNVVWGAKKSNTAHALISLDISDTFRMTYEVLSWISVSASNLVFLDIRNCTDLELLSGIRELKSLKKLEHIFMGPSRDLLDSREFAHCLIPHMVCNPWYYYVILYHIILCYCAGQN